MKKLVRRFEPHKQIEFAQVERIRLFANPERQASPVEAEQLVDWFNKAAFIQKREFENPRAGKDGISLQLKSGEEILIVPREGDFDVTRRRGNRAVVTYWARQKDLSEFLAKIS
jgi:hypothetical protein